MLLAAVRVRVVASGLKAHPAECHMAAAARHRDATIWIRVAEHPTIWAAEVQGLVELWLKRLGSVNLSLVRRLRRLNRLEVLPQPISEEEGLDHAATEGCWWSPRQLRAPFELRSFAEPARLQMYP